MMHRVFVFTVHKAASLGIHDVMHCVAQTERWPFYSPNLKDPNLIEPSKPGDESFMSQLEGKTGLVGPVRMPVMISLAARECDKFIVHLRDPRDVLVSMYYSWSYSHPGVNPQYREGLLNSGVDQFALNESAGLKLKYDLYIRDYLSMPGTVFLKYETFVLDRKRWLAAFLAALNVDGARKRYRKLASDNPAEKIKSEDVYRHIRKAAPGDFHHKLTPDTIGVLNNQWRDCLKELSYDI